MSKKTKSDNASTLQMVFWLDDKKNLFISKKFWIDDLASGPITPMMVSA